MTKKGQHKFLRIKHKLFGEKLDIFSQTVKYSEKRGKSEIARKCTIGFGGWTYLALRACSKG